MTAGGRGHRDRLLGDAEVEAIVGEACAALDVRDRRVLVLVPDSTRSCPLPQMFRLLCERLGPVARRLDFLVALGTHPPPSEAALLDLFGLHPEERRTRYGKIGIHTHAWQEPEQLVGIGRIGASEIKQLSGGLFEQAVEVTCNRLARECDHLLVCGPVFPHEVAGFSGGNKYLMPGIAGAGIIDFFHWLGAVVTSPRIIGRKWTPVRRVIDRAASLLPVAKSALCLVVADGGLAGLYHGSVEEAWSAAADLSAQRHVVRHPRRYHTVLACAPAMYDELWVGGKCVYKLEPVVEDGGRLIVYAPHIRRLSATHGEQIERVGYHVRDYFLARWERFADVRWSVLAHATHVKGVGSWRDGEERPRIEVVLATGIGAETCRRINLGHLDLRTIDPATYEGREAQGVLCVRDAGEILHRPAGE